MYVISRTMSTKKMCLFLNGEHVNFTHYHHQRAVLDSSSTPNGLWWGHGDTRCYSHPVLHKSPLSSEIPFRSPVWLCAYPRELLCFFPYPSPKKTAVLCVVQFNHDGNKYGIKKVVSGTLCDLHDLHRYTLQHWIRFACLLLITTRQQRCRSLSDILNIVIGTLR